MGKFILGLGLGIVLGGVVGYIVGQKEQEDSCEEIELTDHTLKSDDGIISITKKIKEKYKKNKEELVEDSIDDEIVATRILPCYLERIDEEEYNEYIETSDGISTFKKLLVEFDLDSEEFYVNNEEDEDVADVLDAALDIILASKDSILYFRDIEELVDYKVFKISTSIQDVYKKEKQKILDETIEKVRTKYDLQEGRDIHDSGE